MAGDLLLQRTKFVRLLAAAQLARASQEELCDAYLDAAITELEQQPASCLVSVAERYGVAYTEFFG